MRYKTYCFGDLVEKWIDNRGKTPPLSENGIPLLEVKHLPESNLYPKIVGTKFVDKETYDSWFRAYLEPNDILFSTVGTTARVVMTPPTETVAIAQNILGIRFKKDLVDPWFMFYYMRGKQFQHDIEARLVTTVQASIKRADMVGIPIAVPQLDAQKELVHRVISLDHKIQLNQDINQTLEQMAQALFKSWFVDFEPVKAKMAVLEAGGSQEDATLAAMTAISGKNADALAVFEREHPEQYAELKATAELFPLAMQDSELGEIPEGWTLSEIGAQIDIAGGATPSTKTPDFWDNGDIHWTTPKDLSNVKDKILLHTERKITKAGLGKISSGLLPVNTVLMSSRAPVGYLAIAKVPVAINQGYIAMKCNKELSPEFVLQWCSANMPEIISRASGTTFAEISKKNFNPIPLVKPPLELVKNYTKQVSAIYSLIENTMRENNSLTELRDTLLPKLLSGEITLPEAEQIISEEA